VIAIPSWLEGLREASSVPFTLLSDTEGIGRSLPVLCPSPRSYFMVFGTSIGAAYLNQNGDYEGGFNLLGRLVVNMLEDARAHANTGVRGVLQRYVASRGILDAIQHIARDPSFAWMTRLRIDAETAGKTLDEWLGGAQTNERNAGELVIQELAEPLAADLQTLQRYYEVDNFFFAGTSMEGSLGRSLVKAVLDVSRQSYGSSVGVNLAPFDLTYGGAIGAAYVAGLRLHAPGRSDSA
jgi:hypothetical protein